MKVTSPARWDIGSVNGSEIVGMPQLEHYANAFPGALRDIHILYVNHSISDALMVARAFTRLGATLTSVLVPYCGVTRTTQQAVRRGYATLGDSYQPSQPHPLRFGEVMRSQVSDAIRCSAEESASTGRRWMIVEDGGYAFPALHDDPTLRPLLGSCLGAVEHTSRGRWNYEYTEFDDVPRTPRTLERPAVTISGSMLKTTHEGGFVAQALLDEVHFLLRREHQFLRHRTVAIVGYGRIGKALAHEITTFTDDVVIVDPGLPGGLPPGMRAATLVDAVRNGAFLVFGVTGISSFSREALTAFLQTSRTGTLYLASGSSKALEFAEAITLLERAATDQSLAEDLAGEDATVTVHPESDLGIRYRIRRPGREVKQIVLLGNGYPVIFFPPDTHGAPNRAMDPVMTQLFLAAVGLASGPRMLPRVYDLNRLRTLPQAQLPEAWKNLLDEQNLLAQWCSFNDIDWPTYRRAIGFASEGPRAARPAATAATPSPVSSALLRPQ
ncbi:hypothetical protein [Amycolatopsis sp. lyj-23]|uniref:hypothetical protein n=1 Tax=Amycolatopsis sp. lyj-23 TaxID=2789283 RepID=UPI00397E030E